MEPLSYQNEEGISEDVYEGKNAEDSNQLYAQETSISSRKKSLFFMDQAKCDHAPKSAEKVSLNSLQRVIKLEAIKNQTSINVDDAAKGPN